MTLAPIPLDEQARVESLRELWLLDTDPEERFDRVTRMAKRVFDVPIAVFALVDSERVWFKSRVGLDLNEIPRGEAFCAHAILTEGIIQVQNAAEDIRFRGAPLVKRAPGIRFYAGIPINSADGRRVGALAVMDTRPRVLGPEDLKIMSDLSRGIEAELSATRVSTIDEVTGMLNLRGFHQFAEKLLKISARSGAALSLLYADILDLESAATPRGREVILKQVAELIDHTLRQSDILARIGPGRFCALMPEIQDHAGETAGARLQAAVRAWNLEPDVPYKLDLVVSSARFDPISPANLEQLMSRAETSLAAVRAVRAVGWPVPGSG
jgi:diguanylate cyclase (GGDEF)-like protein